jgi:hypothetical protein
MRKPSGSATSPAETRGARMFIVMGATGHVGSAVAHCTSGRMPLASSVRQMKRKSPVRWRRTIAHGRLTYSGPYLRPHFMQIT